MKHLLADATWPTVPTAPLVLVPLGSTEQHGPHLPFSTDSAIATAVALRIADRLRDRGPVVVAPTIPYGASGEHQSFDGTISIGHEALGAVVVELVRSLSTWAARVVLVNGHGGNLATLARAVPRLIAERHRVAWLPCTVPEGDAHAGLTETSIMLLLSPHDVDMSLASPGNVTPVTELLTRMRAGGVRAVAPTGVLGDPTGASEERGAELLRLMVDSAVRRIDKGSPDDRGCLRDPGRDGSLR
ncbi:MAG TPA: mycofactocin biosynthesis peptidyl-dipeptidase MftE [Lacisediminihabitans sp.]|uniref:mycofactocin biosynthesis peptidyl-dipeptidase MftE n=1 Tax=Lacisediminihabitans sp. TaxID=2787631 RepID=UPI002EDA43CE